MQKKHFNEIEGLRAYMALWVAVGHGLQFAGYEGDHPVLKLLLGGWMGVDVFIIMSGFVITHLLLSRREGYAAYIVRRFMRLMPAFLVCCIVGYLIAANLLHYTTAVPWAADQYNQEQAALRTIRLQQVTENFWPHALAHLTMLHGAIPYDILPQSDRTFLAPGWSISLEWQFYLVAPLVIAAFKAPLRLTAVIVVFAVLMFAYRAGLLGTYLSYSTIAGASGLFAVGIVSRLVFDGLCNSPFPALPVAALAGLLSLFFGSTPLPLIIWTVFLIYLARGATAPVTGRIFTAIFANPVTLYLGRTSYSIYLSHVLVMVAVGELSLMLMPDLSKPVALACQTGAVLLTLPVSAGLYRFVEQPGISLGARMAQALKKPALAKAEPAIP